MGLEELSWNDENVLIAVPVEIREDGSVNRNWAMGKRVGVEPITNPDVMEFSKDTSPADRYRKIDELGRELGADAYLEGSSIKSSPKILVERKTSDGYCRFHKIDFTKIRIPIIYFKIKKP